MTKGSNCNTTAVQVALRIRPLTDSDRKQPRFAHLEDDDVLKTYDRTVKVVPQNKLFTFDHVFGSASTQEEIFLSVGENLIHKFVEGYNITILAYGQTSSGKTYTMGTASSGSGTNSRDEGIVPRSMALLFNLLYKNNEQSKRPISPAPSVSSSTSTSNKSNKSRSRLRGGRSSHIPSPSPIYPKANNHDEQSNHRFTVNVSFVEIYNEELHDLLNSAPLHEVPTITIREDTKGRIYWTGVKEVTIHSVDDALYYLEQGTQNRATGATDMNEKSSRSHAIFSVSLKQERWVPSDAKQKLRSTSALSLRSMTPSPINNRHASNNNLNQPAPQQQEEGEWIITTSKFHFVDLAGSERLKRTAAEGDRRKEGININAGLLALGNVISALGDPSKKSPHVPYRDSKLTRLLQDSLGGNATTLMIACVSPAEYNLSETLNTLQYANRARNIKNRSEKNQMEEWMLTDNTEILRAMIAKLKNELQYFKLQSGHNRTQQAISRHHQQQIGDGYSTEEESLTLDELYQDQQRLISDLQRQVEELDGEASVTRERNRLVEKELQRLQFIEAMLQRQQQDDVNKREMDFQHLVEPVIEEYEKSVSKLESQLAMMKAALNHSNLTYEEQQNEINRFDTVVAQQEETINELRSQLNKVLEREQTNETYIQELESKLMLSAKETKKDQEMLTDLRNRLLKFKESDENTEQYISDLEQRLTTADNERVKLQDRVDKLETALIMKERKNVELSKQISKMDTDNADTVKSIMKELNNMKQKCDELEKERTTWKETQAAIHEKNNALQTIETASYKDSMVASSSIGSLQSVESLNGFSADDNLAKARKAHHRKSLAEETETACSVLALRLAQSEARLKEEHAERDQLQKELDNLKQDHTETLDELEEVLLRYHEALEELDTIKSTNSTPETPAVVDEVAQQQTPQILTPNKELNANRETTDNHKQNLDSELKDLQEQLEKTRGIIKEKDDQIEQLSKDYQNTKRVMDAALETEVSQWTEAYEKLQQKVESVIVEARKESETVKELKELLQQKGNESDELCSQLDTATQQATDLHKRLSEALASLTVVRLSNEDLKQRLKASEKSVDSLQDLKNEHISALEQLRRKQEEELLALTKQSETVQNEIRNEMNNKIVGLEKLLERNESEKVAASAERKSLEEQIQRLVEASVAAEKAWSTQRQQLADEDRQFHDKERNTLQQHISELETELKTLKELQTEKPSNRKEDEESRLILEGQIAQLGQQLEASKTLLDQLQIKHEQEIQDLSKSFEGGIKELENHISTLESELEAAKSINDELIASHTQRLEEAIATARKEEGERLNKDFNRQLDEREQKLAALQQVVTETTNSIESLQNHHDKYREKDAKQMHRDRLVMETTIDGLQTRLKFLEAEHSKCTIHTDNTSRQLKQNQNSHVERTKVLQHEFTALKNENKKLKSTLSKMKKAYEQHLTAIYHHPEPSTQPDNGVVAAKIALLELQSMFTNNTNAEGGNLATNSVVRPQKNGKDQRNQSVMTLSTESIPTKDENGNDTATRKIEATVHCKVQSGSELPPEILKSVSNNCTTKEHQMTKRTISANVTNNTTNEAMTPVLTLDSRPDGSNNFELGPEVSPSKAINQVKEEQISDLRKQLSYLSEENKSLQVLQKEKEETIQHQQTQIAIQAEKIKELHIWQDDHNKKLTALRTSNKVLEEDEQDLQQTTDKESVQAYQIQILDLEQQMKQLKEENAEFGSLTEELGKEIHEVLFKNENLAGELKTKQRELTQCLKSLNEIQILFKGRSNSGKDIVDYVKELLLLEERSKNLASEPRTEELSCLDKRPLETTNDYKQEHRENQLRIQDLENINQMQQKHLVEEREKREKAEIAIKKLEKQLDELLSRKSSFLCF